MPNIGIPECLLCLVVLTPIVVIAVVIARRQKSSKQV